LYAWLVVACPGLHCLTWLQRWQRLRRCQVGRLQLHVLLLARGRGMPRRMLSDCCMFLSAEFAGRAPSHIITVNHCSRRLHDFQVEAATALRDLNEEVDAGIQAQVTTQGAVHLVLCCDAVP
jgi:hypothetical protein